MHKLHLIAFFLLIFATGYGVQASVSNPAERTAVALAGGFATDSFEGPQFKDGLTEVNSLANLRRSRRSRPKGPMDIQHIIAFVLIVSATAVGLVVTTLSQRARDVGFFVMVAGAVLTNRMDVNFFSQEWYRGTTRGVEVTALDVIALCLIVASIVIPRYPSKPRLYLPGGLFIMSLYAAYGLFSVLTSHPQMFGAFELTKILRGIMFFLAAALFVRTRREVLLLIFAVVCTVSLQGAMSLQQRYLDGIYRVGGSVEDPNSLSMYICLVSPILVAAASADVPRWLKRFCWIAFLPAALASLLTISRAGIPIFGMVMLGTTVCCVSWKPTFKKAGITLMVAMFAGVALFKAGDMLMERYGQASLSEEYLDTQNEGRGVYLRWARAIINDHPFGVGLGNWSYWVSKVYGPDAGFRYLSYDDANISPKDIELANAVYAAPAHNLAALTAGELGVPGLILFLLIWIRLFWMGASFLWTRRSDDPMRRMGIGLFFCMWGIFLQSLTEWVFRQTPIFLSFHILAGTLASLHYVKSRELREAKANAPVDVRSGGVIELTNPDSPAVA